MPFLIRLYHPIPLHSFVHLADREVWQLCQPSFTRFLVAVLSSFLSDLLLLMCCGLPIFLYSSFVPNPSTYRNIHWGSLTILSHRLDLIFSSFFHSFTPLPLSSHIQRIAFQWSWSVSSVPWPWPLASPKLVPREVVDMETETVTGMEMDMGTQTELTSADPPAIPLIIANAGSPDSTSTPTTRSKLPTLALLKRSVTRLTWPGAFC